MNWEGNEILRDECKDGFPSVEYEKFIMKELNNENKSIFLIDDMGKNTFSRKGNIDLKIMHLLQDPTKVVIATLDKNIEYPPNRFRYCNTIKHMDGTLLYNLDTSADRKLIEDKIFD